MKQVEAINELPRSKLQGSEERDLNFPQRCHPRMF